MKTYVLYHANCADGFGAAYAAWLRLGDSAEYVPVRYSDPIPEMEPGAAVRILDFSYPRAELERLKGRHPDLLVLDHHRSAEADLAGLDYCRFERDKSGAVMAWEHFFPNEPVPVFMQYLQDRDLWRWALNGSREINAAIASYPHEFEVWERISGLWRKQRFGTVQTEALCELEKQGEVCLRLVAQYVDRVLSKHHCARLDTRYRLATPEPRERIQERDLPPEVHYVPAANSGLLQSEVCEALLKQYEKAPFAACYCRVEDGSTVWSLRSRADFDCSAVAKVFGGGGHRQAAGFTTR